MEKDLLDISGEGEGEDEDYWLLKNTPKKGFSSFAGGNAGRDKSFFDCSPLQIPRSNRTVHTRPPFSSIGRTTGNNHMEQTSPSIDTENVGKENTSGNKNELPKLSVERQQMKKKKKNAGFNLRKSLAWDRAFSTEEGVLDSAELSKITGNACPIGGDLLPTIQEESMPASKCSSVSPGLRALEENLFDNLPMNSNNREKKIVSGMLTKYATPSKAQSSSAQKKVTSAQDLRSGSKRSGCPRPPPSSSLKRPANVHTTPPQRRELSVSKVSTTKSDPLTVANNMKRTTQSPSKVKQSQPTQSRNSQRSLGSVSFSKNTSNTKSKTKSSMASKSSIPKPSLKQARRNVISRRSDVPSVSNSQQSVAGKSNSGPMTTADVPMLGQAPNLPDSNVITMGTLSAQSSCSRVGNTQSAVSRLGKPSGLRVPSPSIGYFRQADPQQSHSVGDKHSQPPRSDVGSASRSSLIPTFKKPQVAPGVNSKSATGNSSLGSAAGFSSQSIFLKPSQEKMKTEFRSIRKVESEVSCCSSSSQINESLQHPCIIQGDNGELVRDNVAICSSERIPTVKCEEFQTNGKLLASSCKNNVQDCTMSDDNRDEKKKSCCLEEEYCALPLKDAPTFKNSMDSLVQGPSGSNWKQGPPCAGSPGTRELVVDDVTVGTSEKTPSIKCEEFQSNGKLLASSCKANGQDCNMSDENRDEKRKPYCSVEEYCASPLKHAPIIRDSTDSALQGPSGEELILVNNCSQLKVSNPVEEGIFTSNALSGDLDTSDVDEQPLNKCVHPGNEDKIISFPSGEKDALIVYHSTENVAEQPEGLDSFTADPAFLGDFASRNSDVDDLPLSEDQLGSTDSVLVPSTPAEASGCVNSPCNRLEENVVLNSIRCDHNMVCDGQAVLETEKKIDVSNSTETSCEAALIGSFPDCKDWYRESGEQHFLCQIVPEVNETGHEIDDLTREERADKDDGPDMQIDFFVGSPDDEQNMEHVKLLTPFSDEVWVDMKPLESSHEPFTEKLNSENQKQDNCSSIANTSDVKNGCVMEQTDQLGTSDGCSPAKDPSAPVFSYPNQELEDNSELEDMDLVTESDCSDEEPDYNLERKEVDLVTESELIRDLNEFYAKGILNQEYPEVVSIRTASDQCGKTKTRISKSTSSSVSLFGDPEHLNEDTNFSTISVGISKEDSNTVCIEHDYVGEAKSEADSGKDFSAQVNEQELGSREEKEVLVRENSPDPVAFATRAEESGTPIPMNEAFPVRDDMQPHEFKMLSDDTLTSEDKDKDAKLERTPDPIVVKPPNAVPFSDEWLAAIEAAGEEILSQKSGRVQHSPTEKSTPEPGPWSPVKKKNNHVVGPFDCTKYTNKDLPPALN